jgi:glycosyltransferase involved in cell wall biosynthesis
MQSLTSTDAVYLLVVSGDPDRASSVVDGIYPTNPKFVLEKEQLLEGGWLNRWRSLHRLRGHAFVLFFESLERIWEPRLKLAVGFAHRCQLTIFADETDRQCVYTHRDILIGTPEFLFSGFLDLLTLVGAEAGVRLLGRCLTPQRPPPSSASHELDLVHLYPFPLQPLTPGGELSYLRGTLSGMREAAITAELFSGCPIPETDFLVHLILNQRRFYLVKESLTLAYNITFVRSVLKTLAGRRPRFLYQRHGGFVLSGAILARILKLPLVLEYQGSVHWWAETWVSTRFLRLLQRIEELTLAAASIVVVVSDVLRDELVAKGIPFERVVVNPAAVDPERFRPSPDRAQTRKDFRIVDNEVVVAFVGSFSHWHGVEVLERAIVQLAERRKQSPALRVLRFLLVGDGPLKHDMERRLEGEGVSELVTFTGAVQAERVPALLDAADILAAPTIPMPGKAFFGSPSKLFEYMAMEKAIVASDLDQLSDVLDHEQTALLVPPADETSLADAIELLATNTQLRLRIGRNARAVALERHTWRHNAERLLQAVERIRDSDLLKPR